MISILLISIIKIKSIMSTSIISKYIIVGTVSFIAGGLSSIMYDQITKKYSDPILNQEIPNYEHNNKDKINKSSV